MRNDSLPIRDVTVGASACHAGRALPDREALVYTHAGRAGRSRRSNDEARLVARGLIGARRATRRPRRGLGDERPGVDRPPVRAGEDRRDSRDRQHVAARPGDRVSAAAERNVDARHHSPVSAAWTTSTSCARSGPSAARRRRANERFPHLARVIFIGDDCPDGLIPTRAGAAAASVPRDRRSMRSKTASDSTT